MKMLTIITSIVISTASYGRSLHPDTFSKRCGENELRILEQARSFGNAGVELIKEDSAELNLGDNVLIVDPATHKAAINRVEIEEESDGE